MITIVGKKPVEPAVKEPQIEIQPYFGISRFDGWSEAFQLVFDLSSDKFGGIRVTDFDLVEDKRVQKLVAFGKPIVPFLLFWAINRDRRFFPILSAITGVNPLPKRTSAFQDVECNSAWLDWARNNPQAQEIFSAPNCNNN